MKKGQNKHIAILMTLIFFLSLMCTNPIPLYAEETTNTNTNTTEMESSLTIGQDPINNTARSETPTPHPNPPAASEGSGNKSKTDTQETPPQADPNQPSQVPVSVLQESSPNTDLDGDNLGTVAGSVYSGSNIPQLKPGEFIKWTPESIYLLETTGQAPVVQQVYQQQTVSTLKAAAAGVNPDLDIGNMQFFVNNVAGRRAVNHSDRPELADRNNESESIDPTTEGALTLRRTDLSLPGRDGLDLVLGRYYSSNQAAIATRKVSLEYYPNIVNQGECTYGFELYMVDKSYNETYYGLYDTIDAAYIVGEQKYNDEPGMWQSYETTQRNMNQGEEYTSIKFKNYTDSNNYLRNRYDLGAGWSLAFPSIERRDGDTFWETTDYLTFYDGKGSAYELDITSDNTDSNLSGYQGKDVVVDLCSTLGKSYSNGVENATYAYLEGSQKEYYFSWDGRLLGIKDKKGNEIKFTYAPRTVYDRQQQYINQITDTVGRTVNFIYTDNPDMTGSIDITVNDPSGNNLSIKYVKDSSDYSYSKYYWDTNHEKITGEVQGNTRKEPRLAKYINAEGNEIRYSYENKAVNFSFNISMEESYTKVGKQRAEDTVCMLTKIEYPHSCTYYANRQGVKLLATASGSYKDWVVTGRYDTELFNNAGTISEGPAKNQAIYSNEFNYTHKLLYMPNRTCNFTTVRNGVTTTQTFNMKGQEKTIVATDGIKKIETTNSDWDSRFNLKPKTILIAESEIASGDSTADFYQRTFNDWGGLETYTDGMTGDQMTDRKSKYYYTDTANKYMLTKKEWNQNTGVPASEVYQYNSEGRLTKLTNANGEDINYSFTTTTEGKVKETTKVLEDGKTAKISEIYGTQSNNAYPTEIRQYYTGATNGYTKTNSTYNMLLGLPETVTDDAGNQTIYTYDKLGRTTKIKLPDVNNYSVEQVFTYQTGVTSPLFDTVNQNLMTTLVDSCVIYKNKATGQEQRYQQHKMYYNAYGQLVLDAVYNEQQNTWIAAVQCHYDSYGNLSYEADALGNINTYQYDGWDNLTSSTDPYNNNYKEEISYPRNWKMVLSYFLPAGSSNPEHKFEAYYDNWDRLAKNIDQASGLTELYDYDVVGNIIKHTDPLGNAANYSYDKLNQLTKVTDSLSQATDYSYTRLGKIKDVTITEGTENYVTSREYDEIGQQKKKTDPAGLFDTLTYNNLGLINSSTDPNGTTFTYTYDNHNRITSQSGGGITYQYQYGNHPYGVESISLNNGSSESYSYDGLGRIASKTITADGITSTVNYQYDNTGKQTAITETTGQSTSYSYDKTRLNQVQYDSKNISYEYYPDGQIKTVSYPVLTDGSILKSSYEYDGLNRLTKLSNTKATNLLSEYQYTYDGNSNIKTITDTSGTSTYNYDSLNRLIQIQKPNGQTISYTYDARGNRKTAEGDTVEASSSDSFTYNALNQLTGVTNSGQTTNYTYDPTGLRLKKTTPTGTLRYSYDSAGRIIADVDSNNQSSKYIWGPDKLLVKKDNGQEYYYIYNGHGDVIQILDSAGNIVNNYEYDAWGNILNQTETIANDFKYAGEILDKETGFYYLRARYYDPVIGRFISEDSVEGQITNPLSLNLYTYCYNNPIIYSDPTGHVVTAWDREHCTDEEIAKLEKYGKQYSGGDTSAHGRAEEIRAKYRTAGEYGTDDGNTGGPSGIYHTDYYAGDNSTLEQGYKLPSGNIVNKEQYNREQQEFQKSFNMVSGAYGGVITGFTKHGLAQAIGRDGGRGVNNKAILDAVNNPLKTVQQGEGKIKYIGENATVIVNKYGKVITTWARNKFGWR